MYVRALYDYDADDRTSLSFHEGDIIQVINQLESGWWDGVINGVRGWFPSNYCQIIGTADDFIDPPQNGFVDHVEDEVDEADIYDESFDNEEEDEMDDLSGLPLEGTNVGAQSRADFWIPQATPDGRLFYYNMMTGDRSMELPLESPVSASETGPRDRMNVMVPEKTRPPPEMMARGLMQDEEDDSMTSASEAESDARRLNSSRRSVVSKRRCICRSALIQNANNGVRNLALECLSAQLFRPRHPWIRSTAPLLPMVCAGPTPSLATHNHPTSPQQPPSRAQHTTSPQRLVSPGLSSTTERHRP